jgi:membrane associated rhomboid family serine protease
MIPLTVDAPMKRIPWMNWGLILATLVLSLAVPGVREKPVSVSNGAGDRVILSRVVDDQVEFSPLVLQRVHFAAYQLVTSLFQHADLIHLLGNMLFLFVFGNAINAKLGHIGFLAAYLGIGVVENTFWLVVMEHEPACLGASAAIMGLCGMFLVLYPRNGVKVFWDEMEIAWIIGSWTGEIPGWVMVLLYLAFDVWGAIFDRAAGIGYLSHIVGGSLGVALAIGLLLSGWLTPDLGEQTLLQWLNGEGPVERETSPKEKRRKRPSSLPLNKGQ